MALAERRTSSDRTQRNQLINDVISLGSRLTQDGAQIGKYRTGEYRADSDKFVAVEKLARRQGFLERVFYGADPVVCVTITQELDPINFVTRYVVYEKSGVRRKSVQMKSYFQDTEEEIHKKKRKERKAEKSRQVMQNVENNELRKLVVDLKNVV